MKTISPNVGHRCTLATLFGDNIISAAERVMKLFQPCDDGP